MNQYGMLAFLSWWHIVVLLVVVLLLFGGKKVPELARGLGRGMRIFRDEMHGLQREMEETPPAPKTPEPEKPADQAPTAEKK